MTHRHRSVTERGPYSCSGGGVRYVQVCSCGAERKACYCPQCTSQGTNHTPWEMPICSACGLRHPLDQPCQEWRSPMDPNASLKQIREEAQAHLDDENCPLAADVLDLVEWLAKGGFPPDWKKA